MAARRTGKSALPVTWSAWRAKASAESAPVFPRASERSTWNASVRSSGWVEVWISLCASVGAPV